MSRPALDRLRAVVRENRVDVILCYDPDRLSRNLADLLLLANEIEAAGARLEFITQEMAPRGTIPCDRGAPTALAYFTTPLRRSARTCAGV